MDKESFRAQLMPTLRKILQRHPYPDESVLGEKIKDAVLQYAGQPSEAEFLKLYSAPTMQTLITKVSSVKKLERSTVALKRLCIFYVPSQAKKAIREVRSAIITNISERATKLYGEVGLLYKVDSQGSRKFQNLIEGKDCTVLH